MRRSRRTRRGEVARAVLALVLFAVLLLVPGVALGAAPPPLPDEPIPVHVTFVGSGHFHYNNSKGSDATAEDQLSWHVEYQSVLQPDGSLTVSSDTPAPTAGDYTFTDSFYGVSCAGAISTTPVPVPPGTPNPPPEVTPRPIAEGTLIQSLTYLSADPGDYASCNGTLLDFAGEGEAAAGVGEVLDNYLPGALTARIALVPRQAFLASGAALRTESVSDTGAPVQLPDSCAPLFGIDDPSQCTIGLSWSGTVILDATAGCPVIVATPAPACMPSSGLPVGSFIGGVDADASGPGTATLSAVAAGGAHGALASAARSVVIAKASARASRAGVVRLRPRITAAGKRVLARSRRLKVSIRIVFKPRSGAGRTTRYSTVLTRR